MNPTIPLARLRRPAQPAWCGVTVAHFRATIVLPLGADGRTRTCQRLPTCRMSALLLLQRLERIHVTPGHRANRPRNVVIDIVGLVGEGDTHTPIGGSNRPPLKRAAERRSAGLGCMNRYRSEFHSGSSENRDAVIEKRVLV